MYLGLNIKYLRKGRGMTQTTLGEHLGVAQSVVGKYEKGEVLPPVDKVQVIANLFDVPIGDLIEKDLSKQTTSRVEDPRTSYEAEGSLTETIDYLRKVIERYERRIKKEAPDLARKIGLDDE